MHALIAYVGAGGHGRDSGGVDDRLNNDAGVAVAGGGADTAVDADAAVGAADADAAAGAGTGT